MSLKTITVTGPAGDVVIEQRHLDNYKARGYKVKAMPVNRPQPVSTKEK